MLLQAQEIRACIYHGEFNSFLAKLNENEAWRSIYGNPSKRLKDQELILRFFGLYYFIDQYEKPMKEFLNKYMSKNRALKLHSEDILAERFSRVIEVIADSLGEKAFRLEKALNAAVYDAVMVGLSKRLDKGPVQNNQMINEKYQNLLNEEEFVDSCKTATSNVGNVKKRIQLSIEAFDGLE
jgi:hypothetical protein